VSPAKRSKSDHAQPYALFVFALAFLYSIGAILQLLVPQVVALALSQPFLVLAPALIYRRLYIGRTWPSMQWQMGPLIALLVAVAATALGMYANVLTTVVIEVTGSHEAAETYRAMLEQVLKPESMWETVLGIAAVTVLAPICEEFLFRGTILPEQMVAHRGRLGFAAVVVINGLLFGMIHGNYLTLLPLSIVGAFFAHMTLVSASLWPAIWGHAVLNTVNGVIVPRLFPEADPMALNPSAFELLNWTTLLTAIVVVLWIRCVKRLSIRSPKAERSGGRHDGNG
jgi:uncharacterized protein